MEYQEYLQAVQDQMTANNQWSALQAQKQMDFQKEMSDTAHQREVADLKAAGLNPVLSAHTNGASTPTGAMATNNGDLSAYAGFLGTILETENANARAMLTLANKAGSTSSSAYGNNNILTDVLMALGINKNQAKGVSNTVEYLTDGTFDLNALATKAMGLWNDLTEPFKKSGSSSSSSTSSKSSSTSSNYSSDWKNYTDNTWLNTIINRGLGHKLPGNKVREDSFVSSLKNTVKNAVKNILKK